MASDTKKYYDALKIRDPEHYRKTRLKKQKEINKKDHKNIAAHTRKSREEGTYGNGDNKDWSKVPRSVSETGWVSTNQSENRKKKGIHNPRNRGTG